MCINKFDINKFKWQTIPDKGYCIKYISWSRAFYRIFQFDSRLSNKVPTLKN